MFEVCRSNYIQISSQSQLSHSPLISSLWWKLLHGKELRIVEIFSSERVIWEGWGRDAKRVKIFNPIKSFPQWIFHPSLFSTLHSAVGRYMCHWLTLTLFPPQRLLNSFTFECSAMLSTRSNSEKGTCSWEKIMEFDFRYGCVTSSCYNVERACCSCVLLFTLNSQLFVPNDKRHRRSTDNDDVCARDEIYVSQKVSMSRRGLVWRRTGPITMEKNVQHFIILRVWMYFK